MWGWRRCRDRASIRCPRRVTSGCASILRADERHLNRRRRALASSAPRPGSSTTRGIPMASFRRTSLGPLAVAMSLSLLLGFGLARGLHATDDLRSNLDLFSQVLYLVQNNYVETPDNTKLIRGAIDGMLKTLDPHTVFLPPQRAQQMDEQFHGEYSGIGIQFELREAAIVVITPLEGTPAYRLGIRAG